MIKEKFYQVVLTNGSIPTQLYETRQEAFNAHRGNISKLVEVVPKETKKKPIINHEYDEALLISQRSDEDLDISMECGYAVMYNCPSRNKIYEGMTYLEVSKDKVLIGEILKLEKYEKTIHKRWSSIVPRFPDKEWRFAIYHKKGRIISRIEAEKMFNNPLKGTQGGISYIKIK